MYMGKQEFLALFLQLFCNFEIVSKLSISVSISISISIYIYIYGGEVMYKGKLKYSDFSGRNLLFHGGTLRSDMQVDA